MSPESDGPAFDAIRWDGVGRLPLQPLCQVFWIKTNGPGHTERRQLPARGHLVNVLLRHPEHVRDLRNLQGRRSLGEHFQ
jgi:hypothetical protein